MVAAALSSFTDFATAAQGNLADSALQSESDPAFTAWNKSTGISITESQISDLSHTVDTHLTDADIAAMGYLKSGAGGGDMTKAIYDANTDNKIDASAIDTAITDVTNKVDIEVAMTMGVGTANGSAVYDDAFTLTEADLICDVVGSAVVDIWATPVTTGIPTVADSITGSTPLTITGTTSYVFDTTLTGWITSFAAKTMFKFNVNSTDITDGCTVKLKGAR